MIAHWRHPVNVKRELQDPSRSTRPESLETSLSGPRDTKQSVYAMNDQTFHTPSFGDEDFDIPLMHGQHAPGGAAHVTQIQYAQIHHPAPQVGMMNPAQDGLAPPGGAPSYQQPLYLQEPHTPVTSHSGAGAPAGNYIIQQQPGGQQRLLMMQPSQVMSGPPTPSTPTQPGPVYGSPQQASPPGTTSDDSDDSVPSQHSQLPGDAESLLPIHYCSASRQQQTTLHQIGVSNIGVKRSSPEPMDNGINRGQMQKKPKVQKKKKKRDPNEPQKPVSAYALFFRDTQAAIKGQNPNASFGEVSKIVASMWDGLDSEHKSVYKQKTEVAKKEYLKALAAYRASLVSKGGEQENQVMYNHSNSNSSYGNYYQGQSYNGHSPQGYVPNSTPQGFSSQNYTGGQAQTAYQGQTGPGYPPNAPPTSQNYQGNMGHPPQAYQGVPGQSPPGYQVNPATSPQACQPTIAQSPRSYQPAPSPNNFQSPPGVSPPGYRQLQAQSPPMGPAHTAMQYHHTQQQSESRGIPSCIRQGCTNPAIANSEWEDEYCSNECVVSHCRDVFSSWVASNTNNQIQNFSAVK
ncbi:TOX high mobility group box family member 3 [Papilio machaon]|uniref:TOX high mobility group box family member 3 n=1 Tax=Papilio machaon TaxID=76193 RepID=A0A194QRD4_PAPMA|nr:TOX high mobility group box family member 3 [Papilio machaon]